MATPEAVVHCAEANCTHPLDQNMESRCERCMRPMHDSCGGPTEGEPPDGGKVCSSCIEPDQKKNPGPAKRRRLDLSEKVRALDMLDSGATPQQVADQFGSSKRAIMRMKKESEIIRSLSESGARGSMKSRKQSHPSKFAALETRVMQLLNVSRGNRVSITPELIRSCGAKVREDMLKGSSPGGIEVKDLQSFIPSDLWVKAFVRRHGIRISMRPWQATGAANEERYFTGLQSIKNELQRYDPDCILSVHETTLFYKLLPRTAYLMTQADGGGEDTKVFPPGMETADRLTLIFCTNATGTLKVPLAVVGSARRPPCFRIKRSPLHYLGQENAWFDASCFKEWFSEVLLPTVRSHSWKNIALLVENMGEDWNAEDSRGQVALFRLPSIARFKRYPMEQGIMEAVKQKYRYTMLERVVELISAREEIQACKGRKSKGMLGLDDGCDPNELDAAEILCAIWDGTSEQSVARSWIKSNVLPEGYNAALTARHGNSQAFGKADILLETCTVKERETVDRMNSLIRSRSLRAHEGSTEELIGIINAINTMNEDDLETWLCLEEQLEIRSALAREAQDLVLSLGSGRKKPPTQGNRQAEGPSLHEGIQLRALPSLAMIAKMFVPLEEILSVCDSGDAALHLRQAKRMLFAAKMKEEGSAAYHSSTMTTFAAPFPSS